MQKKYYLPFIVLVSLFIASCGNKGVTVLSFTPTGEVNEFTTFQVDFSEPLAPDDSLDKWMDEEFITFEPPLSGKYKWLTPSSLIFSPDKGMKAGQDYTARITDKVFFSDKKKSTFETFTFHTEYFDATKVDFYWTQIPRSDYKVTVQANLYFNYEVDPAELGNYLVVEQDGKEVKNFQVMSTKVSDLIAINFGEVQQTEKDQKFKITVKKGLKSPLSTRELDEDRTFSVTLDPLTRLAITSVSSGYDGSNGWIEVFTTQAVDENLIRKFVKLTPSIKYEIITTQNSFRLKAPFEPGSLVDITIRKGLPGLYGGKLEDEYTQQVVMADLEPKLEFADKKGQYLMRGGFENLKVNAVNVRRADVRIYEVFENNLLFYLYQTNGSYYDDYCCGVANGGGYSGDGFDYYEDEYYDDYYYDDYYYGYSSVGNYGRLIYEDSVIFSEHANRSQPFTINMSEHLDKRFRGIYVVEVRDERDYWRRDSKAFSVSDLGIIAKRSHNELMVFVNSIATTEPVANADVSLISSNNQALLTGKTDDNGIVHFKDITGKIEGFSPRMIGVRKDMDFNFVDFKKTEIGLSRFEVGGKHEYSQNYDAFLYADRNLFRPGEEAHFNTIVRTKEMDNVRDQPVVFKVIDPRGKTFFESKKTLGSEGSAEIEMTIPDYANTGDYVLELYSGSKELLSTYSFSVEEFVPDKIRVEAEADKKELDPGDEIKIDIFSEYLFGAPCTDHSFEVDVNMRHSSFYSKKYSDYNFYPSGVSPTSLENDYDSGNLDEDGKMQWTWKAPDDIVSYGIVNANAYVTVFDATGRTVSRSVGFKIYPNKYFVGINSGSYYNEVGKSVQFKFVAIDSKEKPISNFPAKIEVFRKEWKTVLKKNSSGNYYYQSEKQEILEEEKTIKLGSSPTAYAFKPMKSGQYEIRIRKNGDSRYTSSTFYAYGYASTTASSFEVNREGIIEIVTDKENYAPGDQARILFKAPFSGKMLVTIERDRVLEHKYLDVVNNTAELELPITDNYLPNVFVSATLIRPHTANQTTPFLVGHGYKPLRIEKKSNKLDVKIEAPDRIKPRRTQEIVVKTDPLKDVFVTLAVVDEGILQIKNYKTPDPYEFMYANRKLSVSSYDLYEMLLDEVVSMGSSVAGGDESGANRLNPITAKRFKLLSFWSGTRKTDANGEVKVNVKIPQFNGAARIMAVAWTGKRFGSADKMMTITNDVVVMPAIPRFLSPNDSIVLPVSLMNTTNNSGKVTVSVETEGPITVSSGKSQTVSMKGKDNKNVKFGLQVKNSVGEGKIIIKTTGMDNVVEEVEIAVRPTSPLVVEDGSGMIKGGETKTIRIPSDYLTSTQKTTLTVSKFPAIRFAKHLKYLVGYPHGCVEQTTSKIFVQLYFDDLVAAVDPDMYVNGSPVYFVNEGIRKLRSMQLSDGSLAYWPGGSYSSWWGSVYAAHFLVEAEKAGYNIPDNFLSRLLNYLSRKAASKETYQYYTWNNNTRTYELKARKEIIYSLYVLSLAGREDISLMNYYRSKPHLLSGDTRYLLAGAFGLGNNWNAFRELLPTAFDKEVPERESGRSFDSEIRANAMMLSVLVDVDHTNPQIPQLVKYLSSNADRAWSTQERSWLFLALGKAASKNSNAKVAVSVAADGAAVGKFSGENLVVKNSKLNGKTVTLTASGSGEVYYFWNTEGVKKSGDAGIKEEDQNIRVRRKWYTREGRLLGNETIHQGDLIICEVELATGMRSVENLVISDLIPAGFEIENPRLGSSTSLNWVSSNMNPDYVDIRDDRILLFAGLGANYTSKYYYMLRAVNAGKFRLAPIGAEAMYDPEFRSYNGARWVRIAEK